jgi:hypothetical protein
MHLTHAVFSVSIRLPFYDTIGNLPASCVNFSFSQVRFNAHSGRVISFSPPVLPVFGVSLFGLPNSNPDLAVLVIDLNLLFHMH